MSLQRCLANRPATSMRIQLSLSHLAFTRGRALSILNARQSTGDLPTACATTASRSTVRFSCREARRSRGRGSLQRPRPTPQRCKPCLPRSSAVMPPSRQCRLPCGRSANPHRRAPEAPVEYDPAPSCGPTSRLRPDAWDNLRASLRVGYGDGTIGTAARSREHDLVRSGLILREFGFAIVIQPEHVGRRFNASPVALTLLDLHHDLELGHLNWLTTEMWMA